MKWICAVSTALLLLVFAGPAAAGVDVDPHDLRPELYLDAERQTPGGTGGGDVSTPTGTRNPGSPPAYEPIVACREDAALGIYGCRTDEEPPDADQPELTPGDVLRAVKEIGLPSLAVKIQPGDQTLVNVPTVFYAEPQPFERSVTLLDFDVDLVAEPIAYAWIHGDGSTVTTDHPGKPYPAMDITHRYTAPADDVQASVDVTYRVRFRVDGGAWETIPETLVASGPAVGLDVKDAAPVLTTP